MKTTNFVNKSCSGVKKSMDITSTNAGVFGVRVLVIAIAGIASASYATQGTDYIEPAKYQTMDKYQVNMAGNQVSPTVETVAIGGALGLKHSITPMGNFFDQRHTNDGYRDKYSGGLRYTELGKGIYLPGYSYVDTASVLRASFLGQQAQFMVIKNDGTYQSAAYAGSDYHFEALGDQRHLLQHRTDGLVWTQPDGTEVFFAVGDTTNTAASIFGAMAVEKIVYPSGFTVEVGSNYGVITNTGFALKYDFDSTDPGLESSKQARYFPDGTNVPPDPAIVPSSFRDANPKYITAINTAIEACNISRPAACALTKKWPKATFAWPGGMPRAIYIDKTTFSVTNAAGGRTDFIYEAQDAGRGDNGIIPNNAWYTPGKLISPRLVEIISAGATSKSVTFTYSNQKPEYQTISNGGIASDTVPIYDERVLPGILTSAKGILGDQSYPVGDLREYHGKSYGNSGNDFIVYQYTTPPVGIMEKIEDNKGDRTIYFDLDYRNFVSRETFYKGPQKVYHYDARGNVDSITKGTAVSRAHYPDTCVNPKTCNKPEWVRDPNGNQTDYTYHSSGQVQTVTLPADKRGIRAQTRYEYSPFRATYSNAMGVAATSSEATEISLKVAEKSCTKSNYSGSLGDDGKFSGSCGAGDQEVVTRYEYDSPNLLLTSQVVEADGKVYRTCFQYDNYGNQIGKTEPKAGLAACPK